MIRNMASSDGVSQNLLQVSRRNQLRERSTAVFGSAQASIPVKSPLFPLLEWMRTNVSPHGGRASQVAATGHDRNPLPTNGPNKLAWCLVFLSTVML